MPLRTLLYATIILALAGCNNDNYPVKPQIKLDSTALEFGQQFGSGTFIGTQPQNSVQVENLGQQDLVLSSVTKSGDSAFTMQCSFPLADGGTSVGCPPSASVNAVPFQNRAFITVTFTPTKAQSYSGQIVIQSNADNQPSVSVTLSGKGVAAAPDAGP